MTQQNCPHHKKETLQTPHLEIDKPTDTEIDGEGMDYMDEDPIVLMLREEGTYYEPPAIVEANTGLKNWAWKGVAHPIEDCVKKIKIAKSVTLTKKIKTIEPVTPTKNIVFVPIKPIFASISILIKSACDNFPFEPDLVKSILKLVKKLLIIRN